MKTKAEKHFILKKSVAPRENLTTTLETKNVSPYFLLHQLRGLAFASFVY